MKKILLLLVFLFGGVFSAYAFEEVYYGLKKIITQEGYETSVTNPMFSSDEKHLLANWQITSIQYPYGQKYIYIYDTETWEVVRVLEGMEAICFRDSLLFVTHSEDTTTKVLLYPDYEVVKELPYVAYHISADGKYAMKKWRCITETATLIDSHYVMNVETEEVVAKFSTGYEWGTELRGETVLYDTYSSKIYTESQKTYNNNPAVPGGILSYQNIGDFLDTVVKFEWIGIDDKPLNSATSEWTGKERLKIPTGKFWDRNTGMHPPEREAVHYIDFKNGEDFTDSREFIPLKNQLDENMNYKYWRRPGLAENILYTYWEQVWIPARKHSKGIGTLYSRDLSVQVDVARNTSNLPVLVIRYVDSTVSVGDSVQGNKPLVIYSNGELRITPPSNNYSIIISDLAGAVMLERQFTNALDALVVNVSRWSRGMYLVNITDSKGNFYPYRFIQEK